MQQLAELDPADYQQLNNMAWVYATATDPQFRDAPKAIDLAQQALVISPYNHHIWSTLSEAYFSNGDYQRADACIRQVIAIATSQGVKMSKETWRPITNRLENANVLWKHKRCWIKLSKQSRRDRVVLDQKVILPLTKRGVALETQQSLIAAGTSKAQVIT